MVRAPFERKDREVATKKVKIGFVGVGSMGQCAHLKNYAALHECEVVALAELREELGRRVAARYGVARVYRDHEELLANEELDGIVATLPFTRHGLIISELLKAGRPVFIEKPLAGSVQVGEKIVQAARENGTWVMVGYHKRSDPATAWAGAEIERLRGSGELGAMRYVRILIAAGDWVAGGFSDLIQTGEKLPALPQDPAPPDMTEHTHGTYLGFVNYYIHQVNLMRFLLGEPYRVAHADASGTVLSVQGRSGLAGVIEMSPYATTLSWEESALVAFEHGYVRLALPAPLALNRPGSVEVLSDPANGTAPLLRRPHLPSVHAMRQQAANFVAAIRGEAQPPCDAREALEDLRVARDYVRALELSRAP